MGIIFTTGAGEYWLTMFDSFAGTIGLVVVASMEMIAVIYVYGHEKFTKDIQDMTGVKPGPYWQITWKYLAPIIMVVILVSSIVSMIIHHPEYKAWNKEKVCVIINQISNYTMNNIIADIPDRRCTSVGHLQSDTTDFTSDKSKLNKSSSRWR